MVVLTFDIPTQVIGVPAPDTELLVQDLWDQSQDFLDTFAAMSIPCFIFGAGKFPLDEVGVKFTGISVTLVDWKIQFEARAGPTYETCVVTGGDVLGRVGSLVGAQQYPIEQSAYVQTIISQSTSPTLVVSETTVVEAPPECYLEAAYDEDGTTVKLGAWMERDASVVLSPTSMTITFFEPDGSTLFTVNSTSPNAVGHFAFEVVQALAADTAYYAIVQGADGEGTVTTRRGVPTAS